MVLLPGVFTGVNVSAEFLGLSGVVTFTPVSKVELLELNLPWFWVFAERVVDSVLSGGTVRDFPLIFFFLESGSSCWLWVLAVSIFGSTFSSSAVNFP